MNSKAQEQQKRTGIVALAVMGVGSLVLLAGLALAGFLLLTAPTPDQPRHAAETSAQAAAGIIERIHVHLRHPAVLDLARQVLAGDPDAVSALESELSARGIQNIIDLRVFPPRVEEIELGTYPEPDFSVAQMLIEARRNGVASAQVHYAGTANENLALAEAVPDEDHEAAGVIFLRLPVVLLTSQLADAGHHGWLRLVQGSRQIVRSSASDLPDEEGSRVTVVGSDLAVEWGISKSDGLFTLPGSLIGAGAGLALLLVGLVLRSWPARKPAKRSAQVAAPVKPQPASPKRAEPPPKPKEPSRPKPAEPKPDLPDWLLEATEAGGGDKPEEVEELFGDDEPAPEDQAPASDAEEKAPADQAPASDAGEKAPADQAAASDAGEKVPDDDDILGLDVPDLDEILGSIEEKPAASESDGAREELELEPSAEKETDSGLAAETDTGEAATAQPETDVAPKSDQDAESRPEAEPELTSGTESDLELDLDWPDETDEDAPKRGGGSELGADLDMGSQEAPEPESTPAREPASKEETEATFDPTPDADAGSESKRADEPAAATVPAVSLDPELFRDGEIRGVVDETLDVERAAVIGRAIGTVAGKRGLTRIAVGRDGRFSGPVLLSALVRGLRSSGLDVIEVGAVPTPFVWFAAMEIADGSGVIVTGSHHPPEENGFRILLGGELLDGEQIAEIAEVARSGAFSDGDGGYTQEDVAKRYAARLSTDIQLERPLKVVVDCGNGIAGSAVPDLFEAIGADLIPLYCDVDGSFPNHPADPTVLEHLEDLRLCVRNFQADIGIALDGDGDRLTVVTNQGDVVWNDRLMMLLARAVLPDHPDAAVVFDVRSSAHLKRLVEKSGGRALISPAGASNVARRLREESALLGGEMNGHIFIADRWYGFDDAIYAAARVLELVAADTRGVDAVLADLPAFRFTPEMRIAVDASRAGELIERFRVEGDFGNGTITTIDGVRVDHSDCWGLLRIRPDSGSLVICFGADDSAALARIKSEFKKALLRLDSDLPVPY